MHYHSTKQIGKPAKFRDVTDFYGRWKKTAETAEMKGNTYDKPIPGNSDHTVGKGRDSCPESLPFFSALQRTTSSIPGSGVQIQSLPSSPSRELRHSMLQTHDSLRGFSFFSGVIIFFSFLSAMAITSSRTGQRPPAEN
jgi:hypothetical protein